MSRSFRVTFTVYLLALAALLICDRHLDGAPLLADRDRTTVGSDRP